MSFSWTLLWKFHFFLLVFTLYWVGILTKWSVLFSLSRAGSYIFKTANIGIVTFLLLFSGQDDAESCFFSISLSHCFITATYRRFSTGLAQARKQYARTKTRFSFKIKDRIILFELVGILKNNLSLFKLDSKTLLVYHNVNQMTKYEGYPNFDPFRRYFNKNH